PNSPAERTEMLRTVGLGAPEELFSSIPADILLSAPPATPRALSEPELLAYFDRLAALNTAARRPSFLGAGAYAHYAPTVIDALITLGVLHRLHPLSARSLARDAASHLRVSDPRVPDDGYGSGERFDV